MRGPALVPMRGFTAIVRYPGKKPFLVGTFYAGPHDKDHDMDAAVLREIRSFWSDHMPEGLPLPQIEKALWGSIVFVADDPEGSI